MKQGDPVIILNCSPDTYAYSIGIRDGHLGRVLAPCCICAHMHHEDAACISLGLVSDNGEELAVCCTLDNLEVVTCH